MTASKYRSHLAGTLNSSFEIGTRKLVLDSSALTQQRTLRFPDTNGVAGQLLSTDGTGTLSFTTRVTSVAASGGTTGLTVTGGPVTTTGTLTLGGTLALTNGGTGQTTANAALNALLPTQTSNAAKVLQTDGTNTSWIMPSRVYTSAGLVTAPKRFIGTATSNGTTGAWSVSLTAAGFTTVTGVSVVCANVGTTNTTQPWSSISSLTTATVSGYTTRTVGTVVLAGSPAQFVSTTVYVTVYGT